MPWKLISFLSTMVIFVVFAGFNLDNRCNISIGFYEWTNVPVFISLFIAFVMGSIVMLPFVIRLRGRVHKERKAQGLLRKAADVLEDGSVSEKPRDKKSKEKKKRFGKKKEEKVEGPGEGI